MERLVVDWTNARNRLHPHSTEVWCLDSPGELAGLVQGDCVGSLDADRSKFPWDMSAVNRLRAAIRGQHSPDASGRSVCNREPGWPRVCAGNQEHSVSVIHSHNLAAQQYAVLAKLGARVAHVHTEHGSNPHTAGLRNAVRNRLLARLSGQLVAVSQNTASAMCRHWGVADSDVRVIPNGVSPHKACTSGERAALRAQLRMPDDAFVVGSVGRLARVKGYDRLLAAFRAASGGARRMILLLVGDGPERDALAEQARTLCVADRVVFAGFRKQPRALLEVMDLFVLPSRGEGLSVSLLEAMAAGCPVAVTDAGESREVIDDGRAGLLLPDDEAAWPAMLRAHAAGEGPQEAEQRAAVARSRVATHYSLDATMRAYEEVYESVGIPCRTF